MTIKNFIDPRIIPIIKKINELDTVGTLQNDDEFSFSIAALEKLVVITLVKWSAATNADDIKFGWGYPAGCDIRWGTIGRHFLDVAAGATGIALLQETDTINCDGTAAAETGVIIVAFINNGATAGTINFKWCLNGAPGDTTVYASSTMLVLR